MLYDSYTMTKHFVTLQNLDLITIKFIETLADVGRYAHIFIWQLRNHGFIISANSTSNFEPDYS